MPSRRPSLPASIPAAPDLVTNVANAPIRGDTPAVPVFAAPLPYPPISPIPRTSPSRLAAATPPADSPIPDRPTASFPDPSSSSSSVGTVLYLAYGSNMAASVFLGVRGIRPLSQINVSAPSLRLTFDLPGMPYREPCFANTAVRELPKFPPIPPPPPGVEPPELPPKSTESTALQPSLGRNSHGDPVWTKGLIGVVYEVTREDYAKIVATEGGGSSYQDVLVPCIELPEPVVRIPEKPRFPDPPSHAPFLAHTLFAPPPVPDGDNDNADEGTKQDDDNDGKPRVPWYARFLAPRRRPDPDYAQPSERYLNLLRDGAREHDLPAEYQDWLAALAPYKVTSTRQKIGTMLLYLIMGPFAIIVFSLGPLLADENGRMPLWLSVALGMLFQSMWWLYDVFLKKLFGDGERTEEEDGDDHLRDRPHGGVHRLRKRLGSVSEPALDEEKRGLLEEEEE